MPKPDGFAAARQIRSLFPAAWLVALRGWGTAEDRRRSADAGFHLHLVKPTTPAEVREALDRWSGGIQ